MKVLELKGYNSLRAFNALQALLLGVKMLPAYEAVSYEDFYGAVCAMPTEDQEKVVREAAFFVELKKDEVEALISFCADANGVPYRSENLKNLGPGELVDLIVAVSMRMLAFKIDLISEDEKKKSEISV